MAKSIFGQDENNYDTIVIDFFLMLLLLANGDFEWLFVVFSGYCLFRVAFNSFLGMLQIDNYPKRRIVANGGL